MYTELEKFLTNEKVECVKISPDNRKIKVYRGRYEAPLGELMADFIYHQTKPFWKRKYYHKHLTKIYKDMLNAIIISFINKT